MALQWPYPFVIVYCGLWLCQSPIDHSHYHNMEVIACLQHWNLSITWQSCFYYIWYPTLKYWQTWLLMIFQFCLPYQPPPPIMSVVGMLEIVACTEIHDCILGYTEIEGCSLVVPMAHH